MDDIKPFFTPPMPKILTIDAGLAHTGVAMFGYDGKTWKVIESCLLTTEKMANKRAVRVADDTADRIQIVFRELRDMVQRHSKDGKVMGMAAELPSGGAKSASAIKAMAIATAIPSCLAEAMHLPAEWVTPIEVKKAMTGSATASKEDMMAMALKKHGTAPFKDFIKKDGTPLGKFEHVADATGVFEAIRNGNLVRMAETSV